MSVTAADLAAAQTIVGAAMPPTPQQRWPLLEEACGCEVWVKHENHTPVGAFKVRGALVHLRRRREAGMTGGVVAATRGNHGQAVAFAAAREGTSATIVVPHGNSAEKNAAMRALGADLIEEGRDFIDALTAADRLAAERGLDFVPSFHPDLTLGAATYAAELFDGAAALDAVYVPIGLGSGICGVIGVRDLRGLATRIVGVVAEGASAYALSFARRAPVGTPSVSTFADGIAVRQPHPDALRLILAGADHVVTVTEDQIAAATRLLFAATHNTAEGAGAAALAGLLAEPDANRGRRVGVVLTGGNIDTARFAAILQGATPEP